MRSIVKAFNDTYRSWICAFHEAFSILTWAGGRRALPLLYCLRSVNVHHQNYPVCEDPNGSGVLVSLSKSFHVLAVGVVIGERRITCGGPSRCRSEAELLPICSRHSSYIFELVFRTSVLG